MAGGGGQPPGVSSAERGGHIDRGPVAHAERRCPERRRGKRRWWSGDTPPSRGPRGRTAPRDSTPTGKNHLGEKKTRLGIRGPARELEKAEGGKLNCERPNRCRPGDGKTACHWHCARTRRRPPHAGVVGGPANPPRIRRNSREGLPNHPLGEGRGQGGPGPRGATGAPTASMPEGTAAGARRSASGLGPAACRTTQHQRIDTPVILWFVPVRR